MRARRVSSWKNISMNHSKRFSGNVPVTEGEDVVPGIFERGKYYADTNNSAQLLSNGRENAYGVADGVYFPSSMPGSYISPQHLIPAMFGFQQQQQLGVGQGFDPHGSGFLPHGIHQIHQMPGVLPRNGNTKALVPKRSLKMLTSQFLGEYGRREGCVVHVEDASKKLNTSRRRMYDIMAVCAEIGLVSRAGKGQYTWHGEKHVASVVKGLSSGDGTIDTNVASLAGLTRGMVSYLVKNGRDKLVEVDSIAIKVLCLDAKLEGKTLKSKLRRAYDVSNVLCALKMVRDDVVKERGATKHKRCLMWKGVDEIKDAIREAEKIDFTTYTCGGGTEQALPLHPAYMFSHPSGIVPGDGMGKDVIISLPEMRAVKNDSPISSPVDTHTQPDMAQQNYAMMQYLASAMHVPDNDDT